MLHAKRLLRKCSENCFAFCEVVVVYIREGGRRGRNQTVMFLCVDSIVCLQCAVEALPLCYVTVQFL